MKLVLSIILTLVAIQAQAGKGSIIPGIIGAIIDHNRPAPYPGGGGHHPHPGHPGHGPAPYPYPSSPYPSYPSPSYPSYPSGPVTCRSYDKGWEEHGSHYSCGECLVKHGNCVEKCTASDFECRAEGTDHYGSKVSAYGQGYDRWSAENQARSNCSYSSSAYNCYVVSCNERTNTVSTRSCN